MISGNQKVMDLLGKVPVPEMAQSERTSLLLENAGQKFSGIFTEVVNGLPLQMPALQLPIVESSADEEEVQPPTLAQMPDVPSDQSVADSFQTQVSQRDPLLENFEIVGLLDITSAQLPASTESHPPLNYEAIGVPLQSDIILLNGALNRHLNKLDFANSQVYIDQYALSAFSLCME